MGGGLACSICFRDDRTGLEIVIPFVFVLLCRTRKTVAAGLGLLRLCYGCVS